MGNSSCCLSRNDGRIVWTTPALAPELAALAAAVECCTMHEGVYDADDVEEEEAAEDVDDAEEVMDDDDDDEDDNDDDGI